MQIDKPSKEFKAYIARTLYDVHDPKQFKSLDNFFKMACWPDEFIDLINRINKKRTARAQGSGRTLKTSLGSGALSVLEDKQAREVKCGKKNFIISLNNSL